MGRSAPSQDIQEWRGHSPPGRVTEGSKRSSSICEGSSRVTRQTRTWDGRAFQAGQQQVQRSKEHTPYVSFLVPRPCCERFMWVSSLTREQRAIVPRRCLALIFILLIVQIKNEGLEKDQAVPRAGTGTQVSALAPPAQLALEPEVRV